jgi:tetratricopeptide (TPR) repeat protein
MVNRAQAEELVELGNQHSDAGRTTEAESAYRAALAADSTWSVPWYDLGLLCKYQGRWRESFQLNQKATELAPDDEAGWWNLGIAATALGEWVEARRAWLACGLEMPPGDGPLNLDYGAVPVRLDPEGVGEVVWTQRLDPARAQIRSVPLPTSAFRWHDIVLHDGAAEGYRELGGAKVPVFNVLTRLTASPYQTFIIELAAVHQGDIEALRRVADEAGGAAEDWGTSTRILCRRCSLGIPHFHREKPQNPAHPHCGVAALDAGHLEAILSKWLRVSPTADLIRWEAAPGGAP